MVEKPTGFSLSISGFAFSCTEVPERGRLMGCRSGTAAALGPPEAVAMLDEHCWPGGAGQWFGGVGGLWELPHSTAAPQGNAAGVV